MDKNPYAVMQSMYQTFPKVSKKIADFLLEAPNKNYDLSITEIASKLDIAESSISRFCKLLGYSGFSEMKIQMARCSPFEKQTFFAHLDASDSTEQVCRKLFQRNIESLQTTISMLDFSAIEKGASMIRAAKHIVVCGVGSSASIADNFAVHLMQIGFTAHSVTDSELLTVQARLSDPDWLFISISKSGSSRATVNAFRMAKEKGAKTMTLTCYQKTPIEQYCDCCILHYYSSDMYASTRVIQNTVIDCIIITATLDRQEEVIRTMSENRASVAPLRL